LKKRKIMIISSGMRINHGKLTMYQPLPANRLDYADPFLLLHHHGPLNFEPFNDGLPFGPHPHRGFDTVTYIYEGNVVHKDSRGHESTIQKGGVQWMSAARGIVHSEDISPELKESGGEFDIIQLWINLPGKLKMSEANYQGIQAEEIPKIEFDEGKSRVFLVAGEWGDQKGPAKSKTDVVSANIEMDGGSEIILPNNEGYRAFVYIRNGKASLAGNSLTERQMAYFDSEPGMILKADSDTKILFCMAQPLNEPMVSHGPFVMNTQTEILQAMRDYQMGKMGVL
jgi:quercetin 2,3-dioxygenase